MKRIMLLLPLFLFPFLGAQAASQTESQNSFQEVKQQIIKLIGQHPEKRGVYFYLTISEKDIVGIGKDVFAEYKNQPLLPVRLHLPLSMANGELIVDGKNDDDIWKNACSGYRQFISRNTGQPFGEKVYWAITYNNKYLYVFMYAHYENVEEIVFRQTEDGNLISESTLGFALNVGEIVNVWQNLSWETRNLLNSGMSRLASGQYELKDRLIPVKTATALVSDGWCLEMAFPWALIQKGKPLILTLDCRFKGQDDLVHLFNLKGDAIQDSCYLDIESPASPGLFATGDVRLIAEQIKDQNKYLDDYSSSFVTGLKVRDSFGSTNLVLEHQPDLDTVPNEVARLNSGYTTPDAGDVRPFAVEGKSIRNLNSSVFSSRRIGNPEEAITSNSVFGRLATYGLLTFHPNQDNAVVRLYQVPKQGLEYGGALLVKRVKADQEKEDKLTNSNCFFDFHKRGNLHSLGADLTITTDTESQELGYRFGTITSLSKDGFSGVIETIYIKGPVNRISYNPFTNIAGSKLTGGWNKYWTGTIKNLSIYGSSELQNRINIPENQQRVFRRTGNINASVSTALMWVKIGANAGKYFDFWLENLNKDSTTEIEVGINPNNQFKNIFLGWQTGKQKGTPMDFWWLMANYRIATRYLKLSVGTEFYSYTQGKRKEKQIIGTISHEISRNLVFRARLLKWDTVDKLYPKNNLDNWGAYAGLSYRLRFKGRTIDTALVYGDPNSYKVARKIICKVDFPL